MVSPVTVGEIKGSLLSPGDRDALDTLMNGPSAHVAVSGAVGRLAVVVFRHEDGWSTWAGVHMPLPQSGESQDMDIVYENTGGNFDTAGEFGFWARFRDTDGEMRLVDDSVSDCPDCPSGQGPRILFECLGLDADRVRRGDPAIAYNMGGVARDAAKKWPFQDPILRAAASKCLESQ